MTLLKVSNLTKYYGADLIFSGLSLQVSRGDKVALVGVNGAGKSTLLRIIAGLEEADAGSADLAPGTRVAYLAQEARFDAGHTLWQEMESSLTHLNRLQEEISELERGLHDDTAPDWAERMERYGELRARFEHAGGYFSEHSVERILHRLGFVESQFHQPLSQFSGGQKTRAALAATLLSDPDVLLLDEPTNHLDLDALEWLDDFLATWPGTLIVVSHDRRLLNRVTGRTLELVQRRLEDYPAGYDRYLQLKAERMERRMKEYVAQQELIARTEEFIRRYGAGQRSKEARGRETRLNRLKETSLIARPEDTAKIKLFLDTQLRSGDLALVLDKLEAGYKNVDPGEPCVQAHVLLRADGLELRRGERVALLGPNGSGKTTLLRTVVGQIPPFKGRARLGHSVAVGYYAQGHESLDLDATVLEEILRIDPPIGPERARTLLGRFLFRGDDVFKRVGDLSGGERSRVALAQLTLLSSNLLVLDEPTNHLDIDGREALEAVLKEYPGSILFVSHDRYFIDALADKLWTIDEGCLTERLGNYSDYMMPLQRELRPATSRKAKSGARKSDKKDSAFARSGSPSSSEKLMRKRLVELEAEVLRLEGEIGRLKAELEAATAAQDVARITSLGRQYVELESVYNRSYEDWAQLATAVN
ncbi:MAG: ABC-F family ATP-binding cassette domain-containing protein [Dehalococcoidia bacterium]|nr:ABC-F family ATP-binding cassette domain-containing protein [Dehalococcoidia bacterium]